MYAKIWNFVLAIMLAGSASAQINDLSIDGEVYSNKVEFSISNSGDDDISVHYSIGQQDDVMLRTSGDTIIFGKNTVTIGIQADYAEYNAFDCTVSLEGGNLRVGDDSLSKSMTLLPPNEKLLVSNGKIQGELVINIFEKEEEPFSLAIYDLSGQKCFSSLINGGKNHVPTTLTTGNYILLLKGKQFFKSLRIWIP